MLVEARCEDGIAIPFQRAGFYHRDPIQLRLLRGCRRLTAAFFFAGTAFLASKAGFFWAFLGTFFGASTSIRFLRRVSLAFQTRNGVDIDRNAANA